MSVEKPGFMVKLTFITPRNGSVPFSVFDHTEWSLVLGDDDLLMIKTHTS
jgi:hypothetical protein